ncbi:MAG: hypothetical protein ACK5V3_07245, partial [Bdellovibrionales bacterium]
NESGTTAATDRVQFAGEGNFREISVSRTLWKTTSTTDGNVPFSALWTAFTSATQGIKNSLNYFRSAGLFNYYLNQIITASHSARLTAWQLILSNESQNADTRDYADPVSAITMGTCGKYPKSLDPVIDSSYSYARSNLLLSNDFYLYVHNGSGGTLNLTYTQATSPAIDLDLYLYRDGHVYQDDYLESIGQSTGGVVAKSDRTYPSIENGVEAISLSGLAAGVYLINVKANTFNKLNSEINNGIANYTLRLTQGATTWDLCPEN